MCRHNKNNEMIEISKEQHKARLKRERGTCATNQGEKKRERPEFARRTPIRVFLPPALNAEYLALRTSHGQTEQRRKEK
jgi:hypothetical protein